MVCKCINVDDNNITNDFMQQHINEHELDQLVSVRPNPASVLIRQKHPILKSYNNNASSPISCNISVQQQTLFILWFLEWFLSIGLYQSYSYLLCLYFCYWQYVSDYGTCLFWVYYFRTY